MKLRNKETGKIGWLYEHSLTQDIIIVYDVKGIVGKYASLAELNSEWEDCEEPKTHWMIDTSVLEPVREIAGMPYEIDKEIGNWFSTKEEAKLALSKLKAWKRLKDKGFRFTAWKNGILLDETVAGQVRYKFPIDNKEDIEKDLDLLFGGKE